VQFLLALHHCHHSFFGEWSLLHWDVKPENREENHINQPTPEFDTIFNDSAVLGRRDRQIWGVRFVQDPGSKSITGYLVRRRTCRPTYRCIGPSQPLADEYDSCERVHWLPLIDWDVSPIAVPLAQRLRYGDE
jgi:hypothetical protein